MRNNFENISVQNALLKPGGEIVSGVREWKEIMRPYWRELILTEEYGKIRGADKISVSVSSAMENGVLLLTEQGQELVGKFRLGRGLDHRNGILVHPAHGQPVVGAEPGTGQQLKHAVTDVGQTQIGDGIDLLGVHLELEVVFH